MYGFPTPVAQASPFSFWEAQLAEPNYGYATSWNIEGTSVTPRVIFDRLVANGKSNKTHLVDGRYMIGENVCLFISSITQVDNK